MRLDVIAPYAEDLMQLWTCRCAEVGQHRVAGNVHETKNRVERYIKCNKLRILSYVNSLKLVEIAQNYSREIVVLKVYKCKILAIFN